MKKIKKPSVFLVSSIRYWNQVVNIKVVLEKDQ